MKLYQVSIKDRAPQGALFESRKDAEREIRFLEADDRRYADDAMREAGIKVERTLYEIHEVTR